MLIRAILFDIDGTLVDSNDLHVLAWEEAFLDAGRQFDRWVIHDQIGKGADMLIPALLPGLDADTQEKIAKVQGDIFKQRYLASVTPFPKAHDILAHAHGRGQMVALASSASKSDLDHYVELLDARNIISATTSSDDVNATKPAPDIFSTALKKLSGATAEETIVVGDTPYDVEAARKIGLVTIALRSGGFPDATLLQAGAIAVYDNVASLLAAYGESPLGR